MLRSTFDTSNQRTGKAILLPNPPVQDPHSCTTQTTLPHCTEECEEDGKGAGGRLSFGFKPSHARPGFRISDSHQGWNTHIPADDSFATGARSAARSIVSESRSVASESRNIASESRNDASESERLCRLPAFPHGAIVSLCEAKQRTEGPKQRGLNGAPTCADRVRFFAARGARPLCKPRVGCGPQGSPQRRKLWASAAREPTAVSLRRETRGASPVHTRRALVDGPPPLPLSPTPSGSSRRPALGGDSDAYGDTGGASHGPVCGWNVSPVRVREGVGFFTSSSSPPPPPTRGSALAIIAGWPAEIGPLLGPKNSPGFSRRRRRRLRRRTALAEAGTGHPSRCHGPSGAAEAAGSSGAAAPARPREPAVTITASPR